MKHPIALAMLMLCAIGAYAQQPTDTLCLNDECIADGKMRRFDGELWLNGLELSADMLQLMLTSENYATYRGAVRQYYTGRVLRDVGFMGIGVAAISFTVAELLPPRRGGDRAPATSVLLMMFGSVNLCAAVPLISTGIPLKIIGEKRLNWLVNDYNKTHSPATWHISPTVTPTGQVGIALRCTF